LVATTSFGHDLAVKNQMEHMMIGVDT